METKRDVLNSSFHKAHQKFLPRGLSIDLSNFINRDYKTKFNKYMIENFNLSKKEIIIYAFQNKYCQVTGMIDFDQKDYILKIFNFAHKLSYCALSENTETVSYDKRDFVFEYDNNIDESIQDNIINLFRQSSYMYGLRVRKCSVGYYVYWDKVQLNGYDYPDLGFSFNDRLELFKDEEKKKRLLR